MAITFTGIGGLFDRLGRLGKLAKQRHQFQSDINTTFLQFKDKCLEPPEINEPLANFSSLSFESRLLTGNFLRFLQPLALSVVTKMVYDDNPSQATNVGNVLREIVKQMNAASQTVKKCNVTMTATPSTSNYGTGKLFHHIKNSLNQDKELIFPETNLRLKCISGNSGKADSGREVFEYIGEPLSFSNQNNVWVPDYGAGSGSRQNIPVVSADSSFMGKEGGFNSFATSSPFAPTGWTIITGANPSEFQSGTTRLRGNSSLRINPSATLLNLRRTITTALAETTPHFIHVWIYPSASLTGNIKISFKDASGANLLDLAGSPIELTINLSTLTASTWNSCYHFFFTDRYFPEDWRVHIEVTTAVSGGHLFLDDLAVSSFFPLYPGGPEVAIVAGSKPFAVDDYFTISTTNDFAGAADLMCWQWLWARLFDPFVRENDLLLPSSATPTISDTLISV